MRKFLAVSILSFAIFAISNFVFADSTSLWLTNLSEAQTISAKEHKPILIDFSGSDWCQWCMRLDKEVFSTTTFKNYAKDNLVLLLADFPMKKKQTPEVKAQNTKLAEKYNIAGFPTVLLTDSNGNIILRTGYVAGGAKKYVESLKSAVNNFKNEKNDKDHNKKLNNIK
ncbi:MAG TPA: thioredoxin family protein [Victivallales bacterium]|nr:thioredoxin family protein [Victivallales bacterium]